MSATANGAPRHLERSTRAWFRQVMADYDLEPHHVRLLQMAGETWDRATQARKLIEADGPIQADRFGQLRPHPAIAIAIERDSRIAFARWSERRWIRHLPVPPGNSPPRGI